jgi:cell division protein FtsN
MWKTPRTLMVASAALVAGLGVGASVVPALAAQDPVLSEEQSSQLQSQVDAYKACLEDQGVTLPERSADGSKPELTEEQRTAMRAARDACESQRPSRPELTEEQQAELRSQMEEYRACMDTQLSAAGITRPEKPAEGTQPAEGQRPERPQLTDEQKAAFEAARTACEDVQPYLGVEGVGPLGGHGPGGRGPGGPGGRMGPGGSGGESGSTSGSAEGTTSAV